MAYNNGFPMSYPQFYPQYPQYQIQTQPTQQGGKIWVQGESGAKSYLVAPNTTVDLWDSERQTIYVKSADGSGMPSMKILDYTLRQPVQQSQPVAESEPVLDYVTHQELKDFEDKITQKIDEFKEEVQA